MKKLKIPVIKIKHFIIAHITINIKGNLIRILLYGIGLLLPKKLQFLIPQYKEKVNRRR